MNDMFKDIKCRGVTEESDSPWTSPVISVQKDNSLWFFMDYRRLNFTKHGCFLLPRINNTLDTLAGAKWFSTLDLKIGYWQAALHPENKKKKAFSTGQTL
jgi:hypothetical protein